MTTATWVLLAGVMLLMNAVSSGSSPLRPSPVRAPSRLRRRSRRARSRP